MTYSKSHEAPELAGAARRMIRSLMERASAGDTEALTELNGLVGFTQLATNTAGHLMQRSGVYSFTDLAGELGTTRQAAAKRFSPAPLLNDRDTRWLMRLPAQAPLYPVSA